MNPIFLELSERTINLQHITDFGVTIDGMPYINTADRPYNCIYISNEDYKVLCEKIKQFKLN